LISVAGRSRQRKCPMAEGIGLPDLEEIVPGLSRAATRLIE
jgi:hypothetical protein